ncbi:MAG: hypothetical protein HY817_05310 [Candidatus Abawacabacteria bacterium]|nr:hypothetical protein [Candidatus Abawacabacteria bacterium]
MAIRELSNGIEAIYAQTLVAVDTICGGNIGEPDGGSHFIADSYPKTEVALPNVYADMHAVNLRRSTDPTVIRDSVRALVETYNLTDSRRLLLDALAPGTDPLRIKFMSNMGDCFAVIAKTRLAEVNGDPLPQFDDRYFASARKTPVIVETKHLREQLRAALEKRGINTTDTTDLRGAVAEWTQRVGYVSILGFDTRTAAMNKELLRLTRENIFSNQIFKPYGHFAEYAFTGMQFKPVSNKRFTASSAYAGGRDGEGRALLQGLIEYNTDHPITETGLAHLVSHEITPGHYIDSAVADLLWRNGQLGFEAVAHTMCTTETVLREGWAQNALLIACGGQEGLEEFLGPDHEVQYWLERLQDAAKNNASILFQRNGVTETELIRHLAIDCVLDDTYVKKLSGAWARHHIHGPMYGHAYYGGHKAVATAIEHYGLPAVIKVGLHQQGYLDIETFDLAVQAEAA